MLAQFIPFQFSCFLFPSPTTICKYCNNPIGGGGGRTTMVFASFFKKKLVTLGKVTNLEINCKVNGGTKHTYQKENSCSKWGSDNYLILKLPHESGSLVGFCPWRNVNCLVYQWLNFRLSVSSRTLGRGTQLFSSILALSKLTCCFLIHTMYTCCFFLCVGNVICGES